MHQKQCTRSSAVIKKLQEVRHLSELYCAPTATLVRYSISFAKPNFRNYLSEEPVCARKIISLWLTEREGCITM